MVLVLVLVATAAILGMGTLYSASVRLACASNLSTVARAQYLAESGLQHAMYELQVHLEQMEATSQASPTMSIAKPASTKKTLTLPVSSGTVISVERA